MPICTTCTRHADYLYTVYESQYNLRLEHCVCQPFTLCLGFDSPKGKIKCWTQRYLAGRNFSHGDRLLRGVFRHLLYNRGAPPRKQASNQDEDAHVQQLAPQDSKYLLLVKLGSVLMLLDAFIRWSNHIHLAERMALNAQDKAPETSNLTSKDMLLLVHILLRCLAETVSFHLGIVVSAFGFMKLNRHWRLLRRSIGYEVHPEFRMVLIPLSLFYSSLTKLFFLFLLSLWNPSKPLFDSRSSSLGNLTSLYSLFDDNHMDREWVVRNILGGISAGFGLRVILNLHPVLVSLIIVAGWGAKNGVSYALQQYMHMHDPEQKIWLAYSIP